MVNWPARKCFHVAKLIVLVVLVLTILSFFELLRGGKRNTNAAVISPEEIEYEKQIQEDESQIIPELGAGGEAVFLEGKEKVLGDQSVKQLALNAYLSDRIPYNRTLKDYRHPACARVTYDAELPSTAVIIIFHNEPYSVVVRTIWSVINSARRDNPWFQQAKFVNHETGKPMTLGYPGQDPNSPYVYLKEIILVDDNSTLPELKGKLNYYIKTRMPPNLIRILRLPDRVGLTRARLSGARKATADTLIFLDAHCEGEIDWLRPLLYHMKVNPHAVVVPIIDVIDHTTFEYSVGNPETFQVGGFTFSGHFTWIDVPEREKKRRGSDIAPTWSPTMAGGLFAINRAYYWELGAYDEQMAGWGGENLEISFRIWQCGGTLETVPCSRVGHVFRSFHPYGMPMSSDTHGINTARMAEVWMDEYKELFYLNRPDLRNSAKIGDVTHRKILREKLHCKSFQWYLDNVYSEKFIPVRNAFGFGRFRNPKTKLCLDTLQHEHDGDTLGVYVCHDRLQPTQYFTLTKSGELRNEAMCADLKYARTANELTVHLVLGELRRPWTPDTLEELYSKQMNEEKVENVVLTTCRNDVQHHGMKWRYVKRTQQIQHVTSDTCLEAAGPAGSDVFTRRCKRSSPMQRWEMEYSQLNNFHNEDNSDPPELEEAFVKLARQR